MKSCLKTVTEFDYAYLVNMLYAKCHKYITDPSVYLKFAKCLLEDRDEETKLYHGAYHNKHKYSQRGEQSHYDDYPEPYRYDEEDRRRGRYRMNDYDNRRTYEYPPNRYYKESNMGFSI